MENHVQEVGTVYQENVYYLDAERKINVKKIVIVVKENIVIKLE